MIPRAAAALLFFSLAPACLLPGLRDDDDDLRPDGAPCEKQDDCKSGACIHDLCRGTAGCKGDDDCSPGWKCVHVPGSSGLFSSTSAHDECKYPCGGTCPEHHVCSEYDDYCRPDPTWSAPRITVTPSEKQYVVPGTTVKVHAEATSPVGETDLTFQWTTDDARGETIFTPGKDAELTAHSGPGEWRATVTVTDRKNRRNSANVILHACGNAGAGCFPSDEKPCCGTLTCESFRCQ